MQRLPEVYFASQITFLGSPSHDQLGRYLRALAARRYAPGTIAVIITCIKRFLRHLPPLRQAALSDDLASATAQDITNFVRLAQSAGLAASTVNLSLSVLSEFFDFLRDEGIMLVQPVSKRRHRLLAPSTLPKPMPEVHLIAFFKAIDSVRDRLLFLLMLRCGLRVSEACSLKWDACDVSAGAIRIDDGKGRVDRVVYLSPDVERELVLWRGRDVASPYMFPSRKRRGLPLDRRVVNCMMSKYLQSAGITRQYSPHCLRHTFATQLLNAGVTLEVLKEL